MIKTWQQRCEEHPDHQQGVVTEQMIQDRMQEEIDELRQALAQPQQEPVAWITSDGVMVDKQGVKSYLSIVGTKFVGRPLYTAPPSIEAAVLAEREACIEWLRNNYQDYKNISDICDAIRARGEK